MDVREIYAMQVRLIEEEKIDKMLKIIKELSQSSSTEDNIKAVVLGWCLEDLELMDKLENKTVPSATKLNGTKDKTLQNNYTEKQEDMSMTGTIGQFFIKTWVNSNFGFGTMRIEYLGDTKAKITDKSGDSMFVLYSQERKEVYLQIEPEEF